MAVRDAKDLVDDEHSAWPGVLRAIGQARTDVRVLDLADTTPGATLDVLARLQVTTRSVLGALAHHCGGLVVDHGWLRILGGGASGLPDLATANALGTPDATSRPPLWLEVAHDVLGGRFAVDGGGLGVGHGQVAYWGPDSLEWNGLGAGHQAFIAWALDGGLAELAADSRWDGWQDDVAALALDQGISVWPPPFAQRDDDVVPIRRAVPMSQLRRFHDEMAARLAGVAEGEEFQVSMPAPPAPTSP